MAGCIPAPRCIYVRIFDPAGWVSICYHVDLCIVASIITITVTEGCCLYFKVEIHVIPVIPGTHPPNNTHTDHSKLRGLKEVCTEAVILTTRAWQGLRPEWII